ncbi:MAG: pseudouridine synthase [Lachnospirales bacterium]
MLVRLQKFLAEAEVASRRKSEEIICQGRVSVNGKIVDTLGVKIDDEKDIVCVDNVEVKKNENMVYIILNKPTGCVTTAKDQFNRKTVMDYVSDIKERIYPVGRLDYDTSGLLIMTNDGTLTNRLTHPRHNVNKNYIAECRGVPKESDLDRFRMGLLIDGHRTAPAKISVIDIKNNISTLDITIHEGRNRQVRKMCDAIHTPVIKLKRVGIGEIKLGDLKVGKYRFLNDDEIKYLKSL